MTGKHDIATVRPNLAEWFGTMEPKNTARRMVIWHRHRMFDNPHMPSPGGLHRAPEPAGE